MKLLITTQQGRGKVKKTRIKVVRINVNQGYNKVKLHIILK